MNRVYNFRGKNHSVRHSVSHLVRSSSSSSIYRVNPVNRENLVNPVNPVIPVYPVNLVKQPKVNQNMQMNS
jgi:hypothetical protein